MITLIVGKKGTGKTKILVDMVAKAEAASSGNVVCIERVPNLTYSIPPLCPSDGNLQGQH